MSLELPQPITDYFAADLGDAAAVAACFTEAAVVTDEKATHRGRDAIRRWRDAAGKKYRYTVSPHTVRIEDGQTVVTGRLEGNFPGSPIDLDYRFRLAGDKIAELNIG